VIGKEGGILHEHELRRFKGTREVALASDPRAIVNAANVAELGDMVGLVVTRDGDPPVDILIDPKAFIEVRRYFGKDRHLANLREERHGRG